MAKVCKEIIGYKTFVNNHLLIDDFCTVDLTFIILVPFALQYSKSVSAYRVDRQCCPSGNRPETLWRPSGDPPTPETPLGGSPDFLAKSLVIPAKFTKFKLKFVSDKLEFCIYGWNYQ